MMIPHTIDPARVDITPAALVERLRQAERQLGGDGYLCACALYQIWCDLSLLAEASHQPLALRRQIRCAMNHAQLNVMSIACGQNASSTPACYPPLTLTLQGQMAPWLDLLTRILSTPLPECYGYDLADTEVCMADAGRFAREHADGHPLVIVGIRSGGSIVAPRWVGRRGENDPINAALAYGAAASTTGYFLPLSSRGAGDAAASLRRLAGPPQPANCRR